MNETQNKIKIMFEFKKAYYKIMEDRTNKRRQRWENKETAEALSQNYFSSVEAENPTD